MYMILFQFSLQIYHGLLYYTDLEKNVSCHANHYTLGHMWWLFDEKWIYATLSHLITIIICYLIGRNLQPYSYQRHRTYYYPSTPVHTNTFSTPQQSIQSGYRLQAMGDQYTIAFSVYCQVLIYGWVNRSTFRVQILPRDFRYWRLSVRRDANPRSYSWESNALTTWWLLIILRRPVCARV